MSEEKNEAEEKANLISQFKKLEDDAKEYELSVSIPDPSTSVDEMKKELEALKEMIKAKKENGNAPAQGSGNNGNPPAAEKSEDPTSMKVEGEGQNGGHQENEPDWVAKKREFWTKYAEENSLSMAENTEEGNSAFTASLSKGDQALGGIKYTSPNNVAVSKDASFEIYKGLAQDAVENNLSVTFGKTMDDTQKAMLMAACIAIGEKNEKLIEMVDAPKLDPNAEYFKALPDEVKVILNKHLQAEAQKENLAKRKEAILAKLDENAKKGRTEATVNERYELRKEQIALGKEARLLAQPGTQQPTNTPSTATERTQVSGR
jgi:hypothetical protein